MSGGRQGLGIESWGSGIDPHPNPLPLGEGTDCGGPGPAPSPIVVGEDGGEGPSATPSPRCPAPDPQTPLITHHSSLITPSLGVVVVAAGRSARMGGHDKLLALLEGRPVLAYCLAVFVRHPAVTALVVVAAADRLAAVREVAAA